MIFLCLIPVLLSLLLLAAHLLRWFGLLGVIVALSPAVLLAIPRRWAARIMQIMLVLAALEWVRTGIAALSYRQTAGEPWLRTAIIIGIVALFTAASALVFNTKTLRSHFGLVGREGNPSE